MKKRRIQKENKKVSVSPCHAWEGIIFKILNVTVKIRCFQTISAAAPSAPFELNQSPRPIPHVPDTLCTPCTSYHIYPVYLMYFIPYVFHVPHTIYFTIFKVDLLNVLFFPRAVTFDLGQLQGRLTRCWKAQTLYFLKIKVWVPLGYHMGFYNVICGLGESSFRLFL